MQITGAGKLGGKLVKIACKACGPPVDAPITTTFGAGDWELGATLKELGAWGLGAGG